MSTLQTPWRAVAAMFILNGALFGIWASRIPKVAQIHEIGHGELGILLLLLAGGAIMSFPLAGQAADNIGGAKVTLRIAFFYVASLILISLAPSVQMLGIALFIFGAMHGSMDVAMNSWASEVERSMKKPVMSSFHAMFSLGAGLGAASGVLAAQYDVSIIIHFCIAAISFAVLTIPFGLINWKSRTSKSDLKQSIFALPNGSLLTVGIIAFCASLGEGAMADWSAIFLSLAADVSDANAALGYTIFSIAMVVTRLLGDQIIHKYGPMVTARAAGLSAVAGSATAIISTSFPLLLTGFALLGIGYAVIMPLAFSQAANDSKVLPGKAIASVSTLGYGGMLLGPPIIGFAAEITSLRWAFLILTALSLAIVLLASTFAQNKK